MVLTFTIISLSPIGGDHEFIGIGEQVSLVPKKSEEQDLAFHSGFKIWF